MKGAARGFFFALAILAVGCGGGAPQEQPAPTASAPAADVLVLSNFTLIDGNGGAPVANSALIATDGRITWIGPASELKAPAGAPVQDLAGKFVMPGLIDLHTHVSNSDVEMQDPVRFFTREGVTRDLRLYASYGTRPSPRSAPTKSRWSTRCVKSSARDGPRWRASLRRAAASR